MIDKPAIAIAPEAYFTQNSMFATLKKLMLKLILLPNKPRSLSDSGAIALC